MSVEQPVKKQDKIVFDEDELVQVIRTIKEWRMKLSAHPETPDHIALLNTETHFRRRLDEIVTKRYYKEKGLE